MNLNITQSTLSGCPNLGIGSHVYNSLSLPPPAPPLRALDAELIRG